MKTITVGFSKHPGSLFSKLIMFVTKSTISHTYIKLSVPEYNEFVVFQASGLTVNYTNYSVFTKKAVVIEEYEIEVDDFTFAMGEKLRVTEVGKPYSMKEIFGLLWVLFMRNLGRKITNPFRDGSNSYICVELAMICAGLSKDSENVTTEDFRRWCEKHGKLVYKSV